jgi:lipid-A-disaccharide synthase-like uncharacterized protein
MHFLVPNLYHDFNASLDWWLGFGLLAQALFGARFLVQWVACEHAGRSVIPIGFWFLSIAAAVLLLACSIQRKDVGFIVGQTLDLGIYLGNLQFLIRA